MALDDPLPISIMAMTAATPMTMPSVVRAARMRLRRSAMVAVRQVRRILMFKVLSAVFVAPPLGGTDFDREARFRLKAGLQTFNCTYPRRRRHRSVALYAWRIARRWRRA